MRPTRTLILALASGAMLLTAACSKDPGETKADPAAKPEAPSAVESGAVAAPSAAAPSDTASGAAPADTPAKAAPETKAPAAK